MSEEIYFVQIGSEHVKKPQEESPRAFVQESSESFSPLGKLTEEEKQVLYMIRTLQLELRRSPSSKFISKLFGHHVSWGNRKIASLVKKGYLEWSKGTESRRVLLYPKGMKFPWEDTHQFPPDIFDPR